MPHYYAYPTSIRLPAQMRRRLIAHVKKNRLETLSSLIVFWLEQRLEWEDSHGDQETEK